MTTVLRVIDFETSDLPEKSGVVIEAAYTDIILHRDGMIELIFPVSRLYSPPIGTVIDPAARAAHHLTDAELLGKPYFSQTHVQDLLRWRDADGDVYIVDYLVAHNAEFEREMLGSYIGTSPIELPPFICTMKCARRIWPNAEQFGLQYLYYYTDPERGKQVDPQTRPMHRAGPDTYVTSQLLVSMLKTHQLDPYELAAFTKAPTYYHLCPIGKYKGKPWYEVDIGFLNWMCYKAQDMEPDMKAAAKNELQLRR